MSFDRLRHFLNYEFPATATTRRFAIFERFRGDFSRTDRRDFSARRSKRPECGEVDVETWWNCDRVANERTEQRACSVTSTHLPRPPLSLPFSLLPSLFLLLLNEIEDRRSALSHVHIRNVVLPDDLWRCLVFLCSEPLSSFLLVAVFSFIN